MSNIFLNQEEFERIFTNHLKIETYTKSIESLFSLRLLNRIDYKPYYQRNYVWDNHKASYFIESILLGTEIPPMIFFNNGNKIEVIDGRQRFETVKRFKNSEFPLTKKGLTTLTQLTKSTYGSLGDSTPDIIDIFLDAKLRIIEFQIVNEPKLDPDLEDKVKKEIFSRYNTGITPLKRSEIDNAVYDNDPITQRFKEILKSDPKLSTLIYRVFLKQRANIKTDVPIDPVLQFIRKYLIFGSFPIKYYARGSGRREISKKLYEFMSDHVGNMDDINELCNSFIKKVYIINNVREEFLKQNLNHNRFVFECLMWGMIVLDNEKFPLEQVRSPNFKQSLAQEISKNIHHYSTEDSHHYKQTMERHIFTATLLEKLLEVDLQVYVGGDQERREHIKHVRRINHTDTETKLSELETLRITKPDPSRNSIDDIARIMDRRRFLVRPSYQRSEVINLPKASAIIESILLGIKLPPIFVYKRLDGVQEVIDGQQRLLTILGFIGKEYMDEDGRRRSTKNARFKLRNLRILKSLNGVKFNNLSQTQQDLILDFELFVVEIEERLNPDFYPVDLFIRLNDKPYPIKENSFEMWNSWVDRDTIRLIRKNVDKHKDWFYVKKIKRESDRDRMMNEELFTSLVYLNYKHASNHERATYLDVYQKTGRINSRIRAKKDISTVLTHVSEDAKYQETFVESIKQTERFIYKLRLVLLDQDIDQGTINNYLEEELNQVFKARKETRYFTRRMQDFYLLWLILHEINQEMIKHHRIKVKQDIQNLFFYIKNLPEEDHENNQGHDKLLSKIADFQVKYSTDSRKLRLTKAEKEHLLRQQNNKCAISGTPIFIGDEFEVDHIKPLAVGGSDTLDNLQIVHKNDNRKKGSKYLEKLSIEESET